MNDTTKMAIAAAVAGGYVLGRTKKAKFAFGMATYLVGRRFGVSPQQLLAEGLHKLAESPQFSQLGDQIRGELRDAGRARLDSFADALHERTQLLGVVEQEPADEHDEEEEFEDEEDEEAEEERERRRSSGRRAPRASSAKRPPAAKKAAPAKKTARKAAKKGAAAKKTAAKKSAPAKKTAAKKTSARPGRGR
ncbi:hypothetical protein [Streptomyces meridianus]|uniref:Histone protein n=1 Tax=Streptomyces meridianus TaxID=2938945 RepID=A0ABT0XC61_9ACTN|nr:hypothetical protein [Streptomyces meridianus]MCM2579965.1 hypothetical protein [Streptomyces meridianus]